MKVLPVFLLGNMSESIGSKSIFCNGECYSNTDFFLLPVAAALTHHGNYIDCI